MMRKSYSPRPCPDMAQNLYTPCIKKPCSCSYRAKRNWRSINSTVFYSHDSRIAVDLLRILLLEHRFDEAEQLTCKLPVQLLEDGQLDTLRTHVELIAASNPAENKIPRLMMNYYMSLEENPDQLEKRLKLASILLKIDDIESALEQLYAIRQADRTFRDDIGQRGMLALFSMLGDDDELVDKYRSRIS